MATLTKPSSGATSTVAAFPVMPWQRATKVQEQYEHARAALEALGPLVAHAAALGQQQHEAHAAEVERYEATKAYVEAVEDRINQVLQVIGRYATVEDPVVASDGFTYERRTILAYFEDCERSAVEPRSNQSDTALTRDLMPNSTLRRIVDQLRAVRAPGEPPAASRPPLSASQPPAVAASASRPPSGPGVGPAPGQRPPSYQSGGFVPRASAPQYTPPAHVQQQVNSQYYQGPYMHHANAFNPMHSGSGWNPF